MAEAPVPQAKLQLCITHWGLTDLAPLEATYRAWLYTATSPEHGPVVLKLHSDEGLHDYHSSARMLRHWSSDGAIRLLDMAHDAQLLEYANGDGCLVSMVEAGDDEQATTLIAQTIKRLHDRPVLPKPDGLITLNERFAPLLAEIPPTIRARATPELLQACTRATASARMLLDTAAAPTLLHGDLHHRNVLPGRAGRGWLAIDPKGYWGEPAHEPANAMINPWMPDAPIVAPATLQRRAKQYSAALGHDPQRLLHHALVEAAVIALWCLSLDRTDYTYFPMVTVIADQALRDWAA